MKKAKKDLKESLMDLIGTIIDSIQMIHIPKPCVLLHVFVFAA